MKLIKQPNNYSCMAAAAAMILDCTLQEIYNRTGHDGSAIIHSNLPDPLCFKGFHIQEIIDIAHSFGYAIIPIELEPVQTPDGINEYEIKEWGLFENSEARLNHYLRYFSGILEGRAKTHYHACAWDYDTQKVYDPNGTIYPFDGCKLDVQTFWVIK